MIFFTNAVDTTTPKYIYQRDYMVPIDSRYSSPNQEVTPLSALHCVQTQGIIQPGLQTQVHATQLKDFEKKRKHTKKNVIFSSCHYKYSNLMNSQFQIHRIKEILEAVDNATHMWQIYPRLAKSNNYKRLQANELVKDPHKKNNY